MRAQAVRVRFRVLSALIAAIVVVTPSPRSRADDAESAPQRPAGPLQQGDVIEVAGERFRVRRLDTLPYVESEYTKRFRFDDHRNPKLKVLRERYRLDEVIAGGRDEFDRQVLLLDWVNHRFKSFGKPDSKARGALEILADNDAGKTFFCAHYGDVLVSAAASLGWVCRPLALRRPDRVGRGSTEHTSTEVWSNQYRKWILFDPTFAMYVEKDGVPLNAYEFRQEWFYRDGKDVAFVVDKDRKRYRKADMPVFRGRYAGFGDLSLDPGATNVYAFIGYVPNTDLMDRGLNYGQMFITRDELCDGTSWHKRPAPADPATDPYFPINQSSIYLSITPDGTGLSVDVKTLTPNFHMFMVRRDDGAWTAGAPPFAWKPHARQNTMAVKSVNWFGVDGPVSTVQLEAAGQAGNR